MLRYAIHKKKCEKAKPIIVKFIGTIDSYELICRKINCNRTAFLKLCIVSESYNVTALVTSCDLLKKLAALNINTKIEATLQKFSKKYRRSDNEFELISYIWVKST